MTVGSSTRSLFVTVLPPRGRLARKHARRRLRKPCGEERVRLQAGRDRADL